MLLCNLSFIKEDKLKDILIEKERIQSIAPAAVSSEFSKNIISIQFESAIVFPGLINSHDHLDFNSFPKLGNKVYKNYREWGKDIHMEYKKEIGAVLNIPLELRTQWGIYKNLINGVTTVMNHGEKLNTGKELITVFQKYKALHSVGFEKYWIFKLNQPILKQGPIVIHVGEGTDENSHKEIDRLLKWNIFKKEIIGIHGVAMDRRQAASFRGLVWCPASNFFLLGKTAPINELQFYTKVVFGTDSSLTAGWNIWNQLRQARETGMVTDARLFAMLTSEAVGTWGLNGSGEIAVDQQADLVIAKSQNPFGGFDAFFNLNPEDILMVIHKGIIRLFDESLIIQLSAFDFPFKEYSAIQVKKSRKYVQGDLPGLINNMAKNLKQINFPEDLSWI